MAVVQDGVSCGVLRLDVRAAPEQELHHALVALLAAEMEEGVAVVVLQIDVHDVPVQDELEIGDVAGSAALDGLVGELVEVFFVIQVLGPLRVLVG